ncbi:MAG: MFS transporter, partial [Candidatus Dormibacteria bacterium]
VFFNLILERQFHLDAFHRGAVDSLIAGGDVIGIPLGGLIGDRIFRRHPPRAIVFVGISLAVAGVLGVIALYLPGLTLFLIGNVIAEVIGALGFVPVTTFIGAVSPYRLRSLGFALMGLYVVVFGGLLGGICAGLLSNHLGPRAALTILVPPATIIGGALMAYGARHVRRDLSLVVEEIREERDERERMAGAGSEAVPMLQVRNLDYSYGHVQVLFDVGIEVRRGEVVALLGTNGAGKSTLMRAISGLGIPDRGVVRLEGRTVTYLDAEQRVELGIIQVAGGRAIFPHLTVRENLQLAARHLAAGRQRSRERLEDTLQLFPALADRLGQAAGTLSGGEQQMLAIAKALLHEPRILLIDELSLGLAPVVVQDLLLIIERLKGRGISMLIVEQSINVALAIADRAYFMEKGQVRFEGAAEELAERDDLVRAVFLGRTAHD